MEPQSMVRVYGIRGGLITGKLCCNISRAHLFLCFLISVRTKVSSQPLHSYCPNTSNISNSTYKANLNTLFSVLYNASLSPTIPHFRNFTVGRPPDVVYSLFMCRGDLSADFCKECMRTAINETRKLCPDQILAILFYDACIFRYSNQYIFSILDQSTKCTEVNPLDNTDPQRFEQVFGETMDDLASQAANDRSGENFATKEANVTAVQKLYGLAQCTPDLTSATCNTCLRDAISNFTSCCDVISKQGGRVLFPSCNVQYENYHFYNTKTTIYPPASPSSPLLLPPSSPPPLSPPGPSSSPDKRKHAVMALLIVVTIVGANAIAVAAWFLGRKAKKCYAPREDTIGNEITSVQSLQYDLITIQAATNNFSDDNKIGEGGFGKVYKGILPNGQEVAVKRLSQNSEQGTEQFKNEAVLVTKIQHRNLVKLLGFCLERGEKILIYEFVPNKSLDYFLSDPEKQVKLDWSRRYKIIEGIARGILYLHEDSQIKIIHRDLKASNILLDGDMNAKISDFGMARIFGVDQSRETTGRPVGTLGYMPPEYAYDGQISVKLDVFSFGVIVLEIISGKKRSSFCQPESADTILSYAWKLWRDGTPLEFADQILEGSYSRNEITRWIQISLLCVQEDPNARPSMANVVLMLNSSVTLPVPKEPAFLVHSTINDVESGQSKSRPCSLNEVSTTEPYPR